MPIIIIIIIIYIGVWVYSSSSQNLEQFSKISLKKNLLSSGRAQTPDKTFKSMMVALAVNE